MKTLLTIAAAPLLTASLLVAAPAVADAPAVTAADLPTAKQFRSVYPSVKASAFAHERASKILVVKSCKRVATVRTRAGRTAGITGTSARSPLVTVSVLEMKTVKAARQVIAGQRRAIACGTVTFDGTLAKSRAISAPRLGQESVGISGSYTFEEGGKLKASEFYFRDGTRVVEVAVITLGAPNHSKARQLARIAYRVSR